MRGRRDDWDFGDFFGNFGPRVWAGAWGRGPRRRNQMFESGEVKYVILRLLKEKPRHGYEIIRALEEKMGGCYTPSAGTVYPTLQLLEDQGYIRAVETEGKKVYHVTPAGESFDKGTGSSDQSAASFGGTSSTANSTPSSCSAQRDSRRSTASRTIS